MDGFGRVYLEGVDVVREAGDSKITVTRYKSCPWGLVRKVEHLLPMHLAVKSGRSTLAEYVEGRPSIAAHEAMEVMDSELRLARIALNPPPTTTKVSS